MKVQLNEDNYQHFGKLTVDDLARTGCSPCINEVILTKLMTEISNHIINVIAITATVGKCRTCAWYELFENFYDAILQAANMQGFFREYSVGFHSAEARSTGENIQRVTTRWIPTTGCSI